jgi:hypothetical protein
MDPHPRRATRLVLSPIRERVKSSAPGATVVPAASVFLLVILSGAKDPGSIFGTLRWAQNDDNRTALAYTTMLRSFCGT